MLVVLVNFQAKLTPVLSAARVFMFSADCDSAVAATMDRIPATDIGIAVLSHSDWDFHLAVHDSPLLYGKLLGSDPAVTSTTDPFPRHARAFGRASELVEAPYRNAPIFSAAYFANWCGRNSWYSCVVSTTYLQRHCKSRSVSSWDYGDAVSIHGHAYKHACAHC